MSSTIHFACCSHKPCDCAALARSKRTAAPLVDIFAEPSWLPPPPLTYPAVASSDDVHWGFWYVRAEDATGDRDEETMPSSALCIAAPRRAEGWQVRRFDLREIVKRHRLVTWRQVRTASGSTSILRLEDLVGQYCLRRRPWGAVPPAVGSEEFARLKGFDDV